MQQIFQTAKREIVSPWCNPKNKKIELRMQPRMESSPERSPQSNDIAEFDENLDIDVPQTINPHELHLLQAFEGLELTAKYTLPVIRDVIKYRRRMAEYRTQIRINTYELIRQIVRMAVGDNTVVDLSDPIYKAAKRLAFSLLDQGNIERIRDHNEYKSSEAVVFKHYLRPLDFDSLKLRPHPERFSYERYPQEQYRFVVGDHDRHLKALWIHGAKVYREVTDVLGLASGTRLLNREPRLSVHMYNAINAK